MCLLEEGSHTLFYKRHFYIQDQAEIGKKIKQKISNTLRLNFDENIKKRSVYFNEIIIMFNYNENKNDKENYIT